jgi:hypothetical protein
MLDGHRLQPEAFGLKRKRCNIREDRTKADHILGRWRYAFVRKC